MFLGFHTCFPVLTFWLTATLLHTCGFDTVENIGNPKNIVSLRQTMTRMLQLNALQMITVFPMELGYSPFVTIDGFRWWYFLFGIILLDSIEFWLHLSYHRVPFLYQHLHKAHHEMKSSWSFGALYNSFAESIVTGAVLSTAFLLLFQFTLMEFTLVTSLGIIWACFDHCAYFDSVTWLGRKDHHRLHHESHHGRNFQQPFFTFWDVWMKTRQE